MQRNDLEKSLSMLKVNGGGAAARHQARLRQNQLQNELEIVESKIGSLRLKLRH
jgi:hypothetical protein